MTVPTDISEEIGALHGGSAAGFGSIRVEAVVGPTTFKTSLFPESEDSYVLPMKIAVRKAAAIEVGDNVHVELTVIAG